jgi:hypothetical protein
MKREERSLNKTFYSFGANHTSLDKHVKMTKGNNLMGSEFVNQVKNQRKDKNPHGFTEKALPKMKRSKIYETIYSDEGQHYIVQQPLELVNDYTKNISQDIFCPGLTTKKAYPRPKSTYQSRGQRTV